MLGRPQIPTLFPYTTLFRSSTEQALPTGASRRLDTRCCSLARSACCPFRIGLKDPLALSRSAPRSEEHTSELQSRFDLVCRLLLEKKKISSREAIDSPRMWH